MKKFILGFGALSLAMSVALTSCSRDDDSTPATQQPTGANILNGKVTTNVTLNAGTAYKLTGSYIVEAGATLTIPAGTKITADAGGTSVYIAVLKGGKININGTAANPVVMSSANGAAGSWGGLTICGDAVTSAGVNATAEVGGFKYGGANNADNSGSIKYLVIRGTGAQINPESQYNGISFYAVGSATTVENVAVIDGADDGVEFFGGTVSVKNLYVENAGDDAIDWTEEWCKNTATAGVTNAYISHTKKDFSTALEGDKGNGNPKFINLTCVSTVPTSADAGQTALQFKKQSGATITKLYLSGYTKNIDMKDNGPLTNVKIDGADATTSAAYNTAVNKLDVSSWTWKNASL